MTAVDLKIKNIVEKINQILLKWHYSSVELFLKNVKDGILEEAEPDAISLINLLDKRAELYRLMKSRS